LVMGVKWWEKLCVFLILFVLLIIFMSPLIYMVLTSFKSPEDIVKSPLSFNFNPTFLNWERLFEMPDLPLCCLNSLIFISTVVPLVALIGSLAAYAESRFGIWRGNFRLLILSTNMVPSITIALALYYYSIQIGMQGSPLFLIMVYTAINVPPFFLIALSGFNAIPREIEEAAMVDGCSTFKVFLKISLPLAAPVLAAAMVITMINVWNEFMLALILTTAQTRTAAVFAGSTLGYMEIYWGKVAATGTLLVIPPIIAGATAQKYLVRGFTAGAIKA